VPCGGRGEEKDEEETIEEGGHLFDVADVLEYPDENSIFYDVLRHI
jgi:hypothetical protein